MQQPKGRNVLHISMFDANISFVTKLLLPVNSKIWLLPSTTYKKNICYGIDNGSRQYVLNSSKYAILKP